MNPHKTLHAWKESFTMVSEIYRLTSILPSSEKFNLCSQMQRAAVSIPVNIAEGAARHSNKEFLQFLYIALGSMTELDTLLLLCAELNFVSQQKIEPLLEKLDVIGKLIYGLIKKIKKDFGV